MLPAGVSGRSSTLASVHGDAEDVADNAVEPPHTALVLRQHMSITEPPGQPMYGFDAHIGQEHALCSVSASTVGLQRPSWPALGPGSAQLPPTARDLPRSDKSSSAVPLQHSADRGAGLQTLTAFRAALQLRESQLLQPEHVRQDEMHESAASDAAGLLHVLHSSGTSHSPPGAIVIAGSPPAQHVEPLQSAPPLCLMHSMSSELVRRGSDESDSDEHTSATTPAPTRTGAARQVSS